MDPQAFSANMLKWDHELRAAATSPPPPYSSHLRELEGLFQPYAIRYPTVVKIGELGFTVSTLLAMTDEELDDMMTSLSQIYRWDVYIGEKYGIRGAVRGERCRRHHLLGLVDYSGATTEAPPLLADAISQEGLSQLEPVQQQDQMAVAGKKKKSKQIRQREASDDNDDEVGGVGSGGDQMLKRQREHPFIVTEPGEIARGKKNGLDYLFHLYEECRQFLIQVQNIARANGEKSPTKVTNQVFRFAIEAGATYINKPKIRHYVHCYALHCLDEQVSNALRKTYKEGGENVGAWRQACYQPLVTLAAARNWDIDGIFNDHPRLSIWYVPTKLRKLCHEQRSNVASSANYNSSS